MLCFHVLPYSCVFVLNYSENVFDDQKISISQDNCWPTAEIASVCKVIICNMCKVCVYNLCECIRKDQIAVRSSEYFFTKVFGCESVVD